MKDFMEIICLFLFCPEKTIQKKAEELRQTRKKRYQKKEYICEKWNRKFLRYGFVSRKEMDELKAEINSLRSKINTFSRHDESQGDPQ